VADVLAGESAAEDINVEGIPESLDVTVASDMGPMLLQHPRAIRIDFYLPLNLPADSFSRQIEPANP
jgi:hypothetical protein